MNLLQLMVYAPVCGVEKRRPTLLHAIDFEAGADGILKGRCSVTPCGRKVRFLIIQRTDGLHACLLWPPHAAEKPDFVRCRVCWVATGKKRPRKAKHREVVA